MTRLLLLPAIGLMKITGALRAGSAANAGDFGAGRGEMGFGDAGFSREEPGVTLTGSPRGQRALLAPQTLMTGVPGASAPTPFLVRREQGG